MFCNTPQVNQLTALLRSHHITDVVVCPGSRNATIVHNLHELPDVFHLHPITDERSAAFVALGMTLATERTVAVCVTSGSALLNCIPAVAEAYYRHLPLLVISADRPQQWIDQLDGQTLCQPQALMPYCPTFSLVTPRSELDHWANNRAINEAILRTQSHGGCPSHINVAIEEPMFQFSTPSLPDERIIKAYIPEASMPIPEEVVRMISEARLPALVIGQYEKGDIRNAVNSLVADAQLLVLSEIISDVQGNELLNAFDVLSPMEDERLVPDVVVQIGGNFVHKAFKQTLRKAACRVVRIGFDDHLPDTFCHLSYHIQAETHCALEQLVGVLPKHRPAVEKARTLLEQKNKESDFSTHHSASPNDVPTISATLKELHSQLTTASRTFTLHLANSTAVRAAGRVFRSGTYPIFCNRGVNGIEGSLSTAVGYAMKMWGLSIVVIGDLSYFYDANALWNTRLPSNLRVLLLNNGHGAIFDHLPGLSASPARNEFVAAGGRRFSAEGICQAFSVGYEKTTCVADLPSAISWLLNEEVSTAQLLEVMV